MLYIYIWPCSCLILRQGRSLCETHWVEDRTSGLCCTRNPILCPKPTRSWPRNTCKGNAIQPGGWQLFGTTTQLKRVSGMVLVWHLVSVNDFFVLAAGLFRFHILPCQVEDCKDHRHVGMMASALWNWPMVLLIQDLSKFWFWQQCEISRAQLAHSDVLLAFDDSLVVPDSRVTFYSIYIFVYLCIYIHPLF